MRFEKGIFINCPNAYESPKTLIAAMERAKNLGADGVQLSDMTTLDKAYAGFRKEIRTAADSMGLEICAVCGEYRREISRYRTPRRAVRDHEAYV